MPRSVGLAPDVAAQILAAQQEVERRAKRARIEVSRAEVALYDAQQALEAVLAPIVAEHGIGPADALAVDGTTLTITETAK